MMVETTQLRSERWNGCNTKIRSQLLGVGKFEADRTPFCRNISCKLILMPLSAAGWDELKHLWGSKVGKGE